MKELVKRFKAFYKEQLNEEFPTEPAEQMMDSIEAVFKSWNNERAIYYRRQNDIPSDWGTAVNVQMMVFGNMGDNCGTGVAFTRSPSTGENKLFGEFLMNAQGEDVVAGVRTPNTIDQLKEIAPAAFDQFVDICSKLEKHYKNMQDMEFTIENGKLYMLQTRNGKRTAQAALKVACDMVDEGLVTPEEAVMMVEPQQLDALLHPNFDPEALKKQNRLHLHFLLLLELHPVRSYSLLKKPLKKLQKAKRLFLSVLKHLQKIFRYGCRSGYPDCSWWYDFPCCCSCPRNGCLLCIGCWRYRNE